MWRSLIFPISSSPAENASFSPLSISSTVVFWARVRWSSWKFESQSSSARVALTSPTVAWSLCGTGSRSANGSSEAITVCLGRKTFPLVLLVTITMTLLNLPIPISTTAGCTSMVSCSEGSKAGSSRAVVPCKHPECILQGMADVPGGMHLALLPDFTGRAGV